VTASGVLVLFLMTGLGLVGFIDDFIKLFMRRSLGLRSGAKLAGQVVAGAVFAVLVLRFPDSYDLTPASVRLSFLTDFGVSIGPVLFVVWVIVMVTGTSNAVNFTDGLDGLASGPVIMVLAAYVIIGGWQYRSDCIRVLAPGCYDVRDPLDAAVVAAAVAGACFGFLWWNAPPAKIFMDDTGSLALGGALAGLAIVTRTELLLVLLGGLFVIITLSVVIQVGSYKLTRRRVFRMAPLQHHFELAGWAEATIVVRFWLIAGMFGRPDPWLSSVMLLAGEGLESPVGGDARVRVWTATGSARSAILPGGPGWRSGPSGSTPIAGSWRRLAAVRLATAFTASMRSRAWTSCGRCATWEWIFPPSGRS
jgi:phospho-N-acetylmuramoyl-pentapeptide-transferase